MNPMLSRKFLLAIATMLGASVLVWLGHISDGVYSAVIIADLGGYFAANVTQKATVSRES